MVTQGQSLLFPDVSASTLERARRGPAARAMPTGCSHPHGGPARGQRARRSARSTLFASNRQYRSEDLALAEAVAERVAAALENARLYEMARQAIHARDEFLVLAAHELRTPLTALQLYAHGADRGRREARSGRGRAGEALARQVQRLSALVERMCDAARDPGRGDGARPRARATSPRSSETARRCDGSRRDARRSVVAVQAGAAVLGGWDRARVAQLVDELLDNAIKFGDDKPIEIALDRDGKRRC